MNLTSKGFRVWAELHNDGRNFINTRDREFIRVVRRLENIFNRVPN